jgi:hypothetical protein
MKAWRLSFSVSVLFLLANKAIGQTDTINYSGFYIKSPGIFTASPPMIFSQRAKKVMYNPKLSLFTNDGVDMRISKKPKLNLNLKVDISTNPSLPAASVFTLGLKINI